MPVQMIDSISVSRIPASAPAVAGYVGGHWRTCLQLLEMFPRAYHLSIAVTVDEDAECLDIEGGNAVPYEASAWVRRQLARGVPRPWCTRASAAWIRCWLHLSQMASSEPECGCGPLTTRALRTSAARTAAATVVPRVPMRRSGPIARST
jgi:hypothetical protein